jgi:hypothetical protein
VVKSQTISVNRAPVLTLWAAVVAQRLGFDEDEALTLGRAVAGLNAYSKGVSLGLFQPSSKEVKDQREKLKHGEQLTVDLFHRAVPVVRTKDGLRATGNDRPIAPESVRRYLEGKFGDALDPVTAAMKELARSRPPGEIAKVGFALYEKFRPVVPGGVRGWGATGKLDLGVIRGLERRVGQRTSTKRR